MKIGVAGCGRMGLPMLQALRQAKFDAIGFDIKPPKSFGAQANIVTNEPDQFAQHIDTLITVVRDVGQTEDVLFGQQNFSVKAERLERIIISSTLSPKYVLGLRARTPEHITLIDAPMSGAVVGAEQRTLAFMLGGEDPVLNDIMPIVSAMGAHMHKMGPYGSGMQAKVLNNLLAAASTAMTRQVVGWADQAGLDRTKFLSLVDSASGQNWLASGFETIEFAKHGFAEDNSIGILAKDIDSALDALPSGADTALIQAVRQVVCALVDIDDSADKQK